MARQRQPVLVAALRLPSPDTQVALEGLPGGACVTLALSREDGMLRVEPPRVGGRPVPARVGRSVRVHYRDDGVPCVATGKIASADAEPAALVIAVSCVERNQRRMCVRVPVQLPVAVSVHLDDGEEPVIDRLVAEDISAGGLRLRSACEYAVGTSMVANFVIDDQLLSVPCTVVRTVHDDRPIKLQWVLGVRFDEVDADATERITHHVFNRQRELRGRASGMA